MMKNRKPDQGSAFKQQKLVDWQPKLGLPAISFVYFIIGIIFVPLGVFLAKESNNVKEFSIKYDGPNADVEGCSITTANAGEGCTLTFSFNEKVTGPVYVYYEVENFYQNHRRYVKSRSAGQLMGHGLNKDQVESDCYPMTTTIGSLLLNPCGLIANTYFNDVFEFSTTNTGYEMDEDGISWATDDDVKYQQPNGFVSSIVEIPYASCEEVLGGKYSNCKNYTDSEGDLYYYYYPHDDEVQYLYETFPQISPILGVTDEHFINWMRTAGLKDFRKLYGKIDKDIAAGDELQFSLELNFDVSDFSGSKSLILTNFGSIGSKNKALGVIYIVVGSFSMAIGTIFLLKLVLRPRLLGDIRQLGWDGI